MIGGFLFYLHLVATSIMIGVIWVVQLVHYPSFHYIDRNRYGLFQQFHMRYISDCFSSNVHRVNYWSIISAVTNIWK